jgi:hypothetical protein
VVEPGVVIFDGRHGQRGKRHNLPGKIGGDIRDEGTSAIDRTHPVGWQRCIGNCIDSRVVERRAVRREEAVGNHVIRHDEAQDGQALGPDQYALARGGAGGQVCRERKRLRDAGMRARECVSRPEILAVHAERLAQHDELYGAIGVEYA